MEWNRMVIILICYKKEVMTDRNTIGDPGDVYDMI